MIYVDTSALVPLFIREPMSDKVVAWIDSSGERLAVSEWALVEFASAASIKVRTGQVAGPLARQAVARVREFAQTHCVIAVPGHAEFQRAAELSADPMLNLRAGDALHLAIAASLGVSGLLCLDAAMAEAARGLGIQTITP
jgi:predicted nucleic acid-binding protein